MMNKHPTLSYSLQILQPPATKGPESFFVPLAVDSCIAGPRTETRLRGLTVA